ncbi:MAG: preprotein translocase subunit YajC [Bdellovibrionaceae bacterium]|nr:preprotein translocase subunit YajC [Pseudobdellovibrionaceae bacterium]
MALPFIVMLGVFYFLILRPQSRRMKDHDNLLKGIKRGDQVITASGILGTVDGMTDAIVTLEIAHGVKAKFLRKQIVALQSSLEKGPSEKKA